MHPGELKQEQKDMVWRYAHCAGLWRRKQGRNFASLESDLRAGHDEIGMLGTSFGTALTGSLYSSAGPIKR